MGILRHDGLTFFTYEFVFLVYRRGQRRAELRALLVIGPALFNVGPISR